MQRVTPEAPEYLHLRLYDTRHCATQHHIVQTTKPPQSRPAHQDIGVTLVLTRTPVWPPIFTGTWEWPPVFIRTSGWPKSSPERPQVLTRETPSPYEGDLQHSPELHCFSKVQGPRSKVLTWTTPVLTRTQRWPLVLARTPVLTMDKNFPITGLLLPQL